MSNYTPLKILTIKIINKMKREIKVSMPKDGYISWFVTTQNALKTRVELRDEKGNLCFSEQKEDRPEDKTHIE